MTYQYSANINCANDQISNDIINAQFIYTNLNKFHKNNNKLLPIILNSFNFV